MQKREHKGLDIGALAQQLGARIDELRAVGTPVTELSPDRMIAVDRGVRDAVLPFLSTYKRGSRIEKSWEEFAEVFRAVRPDLAGLWPSLKEREAKELQEVVQELVRFIKKRNPPVFSSAWLKEENKDLFYKVRNRCVGQDGKRDWNIVLLHPDFPVSFRERWRNKREERKLHPVDVGAARESLKNLVAGENLSPIFFQKYLGAATFRRINDALPLVGDRRDWKPLLMEIDKGLTLSDQVSKRWGKPKRKRIVDRSTPTKPAKEEFEPASNLHLLFTASTDDERKRLDAALLSLVFGVQRGYREAALSLENLFKPLIADWSATQIDFKFYQKNSEAALKILRRCAEKFSTNFRLSFIDYFKLHLKNAAKGMK